MSVYKIGDRKWRAQYNRKSLGVHPTKAKAQRAVAEHVAGVRDDPAEKLTISQWRDRWLTQMEPGRKPATMDSYRYQTAAFVREHGAQRVSTFTKAQAADWAAAHPSTVGVVGQMFRRAVSLDLVSKDPFEGQRRPQYGRKLAPDWLTLDDLRRLETVARSVPADEDFGVMLSSLITVAAWTAVRPGELFALRPSAITGNRAHIFRAVEASNRDGTPKNAAGNRTIVFPPPAQRAVERAYEASDVLWPGRLTNPDAPVFCNRNGRIWTRAGFGYHWDRIRERFGRPGMDFYELRHLGVTQLIQAGADYPSIAVQVGHSNTKQIERVYGHPNNEHARKRLDAAMALLEKVHSAPAEDGPCADSGYPLETTEPRNPRRAG